MNLDREKLAALSHEQWAGWMKYLFSKCSLHLIINKDNILTSSGSMTIPKWAVDRWTRQMSTPYDQLSEEEKESDRIEADKVIQLIKEDNHES